MSASIDLLQWSVPVPEAGCFVWLGCMSTSGYGRVRSDGKTQQAHRVAWQQTNGVIPEGMQVCHKCDTRCCVNPDHLFLGTNGDNIRDMVAKGRNWQSKLTHCRQGHPLSGGNIRMYGRKRQCIACNKATKQRSLARVTGAQS